MDATYNLMNAELVWVFTPQCRCPVNAGPAKIYISTITSTSTRAKMVNEIDMEKAIAELELDDTILYSVLAVKYNLIATTISRRWRKITSSRAKTTEHLRRHLSDIEEQDLIHYMLDLASYGIFLTPKILTIIAEGRVSHAVGKNWSRKFVLRHSSSLVGTYLNGFDKVRHDAEDPDAIQCFFDNASISHYLGRSMLIEF